MGAGGLNAGRQCEFSERTAVGSHQRLPRTQSFKRKQKKNQPFLHFSRQQAGEGSSAWRRLQSWLTAAALEHCRFGWVFFLGVNWLKCQAHGKPLVGRESRMPFKPPMSVGSRECQRRSGRCGLLPTSGVSELLQMCPSPGQLGDAAGPSSRSFIGGLTQEICTWKDTKLRKTHNNRRVFRHRDRFFLTLPSPPVCRCRHQEHFPLHWFCDEARPVPTWKYVQKQPRDGNRGSCVGKKNRNAFKRFKKKKKLSTVALGVCLKEGSSHKKGEKIMTGRRCFRSFHFEIEDEIWWWKTKGSGEGCWRALSSFLWVALVR